MTSAELADMRGALTTLRNCLASLRLTGGESLHLLRLMNDVERLQVDLDDMAGSAKAGHMAQSPLGSFARDDVVYIADGHMTWHDTDDEGIGGHRR